MSEKLKPIYRFVVDMNTGELHRNKITKYRKIQPSALVESKFYLRWTDVNGNFHDISSSSIDRFINGMYYSYCGDEKKAREAIIACTKTKIAKAQSDLTRCSAFYDLMKRG